MMLRTLIFFLTLYLFLACSGPNETANIEKWKNEVIETERAFARMAKEKSISEAFIYFAAENAVLNRDNTLIKERQGIIEHFGPVENTKTKRSLEWEPDFVDVATSGDLAYTYGKFLYTKTDSTGTTSQEGIFHTVWKRQKDGSWKYVWD